MINAKGMKRKDIVEIDRETLIKIIELRYECKFDKVSLSPRGFKGETYHEFIE